MKLFKQYIATVILACSVFALAAFLPGCGTLDTSGPYAGDATLYKADSTVWTAYQAVDAALKWETANDVTVSASVRNAANSLRVNFPKAEASYAALRAAYVANATAGNQASLQAAVNDLLALAQAASGWLPSATATAPTPSTSTSK